MTDRADSLADIIQIEQLNSRYAVALDGLVPDAARVWAATFTADGRMTIADSDGTVMIEATGSMALEVLWPRFPEITVTRHWFTNLMVTVRGDAADMTVYCMAMMVGAVPSSIIRTGVYTDRLVKADGAWRFRERLLTLDPSSDIAVAELRDE